MRHDNKNDPYRFMYQGQHLGHHVFVHSSASVTGAANLGHEESACHCYNAARCVRLTGPCRAEGP